nr:hypothetical protein [Tanacetum cinerariifolium]
MAVLRYKDEHNKVGYLLKPIGSDDYHQIIDFLRASHIRYALTHNPIIFDSLVKQFWSTTTLKAPELVLEHGQSLDPNTVSFSRSHKTDAGPFTNVEDAPVGNTFHISSPRFTQAPPAGQPSGDAEDPITLTTLSFIVSTLMQKVNSLETELKDHKKLFKDVVGELVKKVKAMKVKQKTKKRKIVVSDSDQEDSGKQEMDLDALRTLANAAVTVDTNIPPGNTSQILAASPSGASTVSLGASTISPGVSTVSPGASTVPASSLRVPTDVSPSVAPVESPISSMPKVPHSPAVSSPLSSRTKRKYLAQKHITKPKSTLLELDLDADAQTFIKVVVNEDSDDEGSLIWFALVGWELIPTHLGDVNALYLIDGSTKHWWLKTISGEVLYMFMDVSYPLSIKLMERMLMHKLEIDMGNDMTTVEQLIQFIKNQLAAAQASFV